MSKALSTLALVSFMFFAVFKGAENPAVDGGVLYMGMGPFASKNKCEVIASVLASMESMSEFQYVGCKSVNF